MRSPNTHNNKTSRFTHIAIFLCTTLMLNSPAWSAVMNVTYDQFELHSNMIWDSTPGNPSTEPDGTVVSDSLSGSVFGDGVTFSSVYTYSNMGFTAANIEEYSSTQRETVLIQSNYDDDCNCLPDHGFAQATWNLEFDVVGSDGFLSISGWWPNNTSTHINQVLLTDLTTGDSNLFQNPGSMNLLDGHSYSLSALSQQSLWGLDGYTTLQTTFNNLSVNVPEPSTLLLLTIGLGFIGFRKYAA